MLRHCVVHISWADVMGECGATVATLQPTLLRMDGYAKWMAIPSGWLFQVDGYSE